MVEDRFIHIMGRRILVKSVTRDQSADTYLGRANIDCGQIQIMSSQHEDSARDTLFHEVVHVCDMAIQAKENRLSEQQTVAIASTLFSVLSDPRNKWLVDAVVSGVMPEGMSFEY